MAIIENDKDRVLQAATVRLEYTADNYIYFSNAAPVFNVNADNVASPANYTITANLTGSLKGTVTWSVVSGTISTSGQSGNNWTIAYADLTSDTAVIRATLNFLGLSYSSQLTVSKIKAGVSAISATLSKESHLFPALEDGIVTSYVGSGTEIRVLQGTTELVYDGVGTTNGTWKITATGTNITVGTITDSGTYATVGEHGNFTLAVDSASIQYTITGKTSVGTAFTIVKSQTFSKAKAGTNGTKTAIIFAYKRSNTTVSDDPGAVDYSFITKSITTSTLANSWQKTIPSGLFPLYVTSATAATITDTDSIAANEWSAPVILSQNGIDGLTTLPVFLYARNSSKTSAPSVNTAGSSTYTFNTGGIIGQPSGWTRGIPDTSLGSVLWVIQATAISITNQATILNSDWSAAQVFAADGTPGTPGSPGSPGSPGLPGDPGNPGPQGIVARIAYQLVAQTTSSPAYTAYTYGAGVLPGSSWSATAPAATVGNVVWYSYGRYNPNSFTHEGISSLVTEWSTPIAASVFQDIKSDNWNGGTPAGGNFSGATVGYYLSKTEGSLYGSAIYLRGNSEVDIGGKIIVRGSNLGAQTVPTFTINSATWTTAVANYGYVSENSTYSAGSGNPNIIRAAVTGYSYNQSSSTLNVGVVGIGVGNSDALGVNSSLGVIGVGRLGGGWFESSGSSGFAIWAVANGSGAKAAHLKGQVDIYGTTNIIGYDLNVTGNIIATGNVVAYSPSDKRLKTNITKIKNPLEKLRALGGYTYDWTPDYLAKFTKEIKSGLIKPHDVGVIAQEVLMQLPEAVNTRKDGTLAVNYEKLVPLLIEAILELDRRVK